ncbi:MAG: 16S rRNA (adenine(1518)-N(6)/adenine(1519)-N(6))-dimethyltransferase RsmA [Bacteroidales bacterium]
MRVRPKKSFGQHFLRNNTVAQKIASGLDYTKCTQVLEIGPGTGKITKELLTQSCNLKVVELDIESVNYLTTNNIIPKDAIIHDDFLKMNIATVFHGTEFNIIGNFPYNISSQIVFKVLENRTLIPQITGMFQREMARRICSEKGSKEYGIISVLTQAFYETRYNFTVHEKEFNPPPKVKSGVITLTRKKELFLDCDELLFITVVKTAFNQRRKTLGNSLKKLLNGQKLHNNFGSLRPEQLDVSEFIELTHTINSLINK